MDKYGYEGSEQFRPLSPWAYFGYSILFSLPLIGFILLIVFSFSNNNINLRSFARSHWCGYVIFAAVLIILLATGAAASLASLLHS